MFDIDKIAQEVRDKGALIDAPRSLLVVHTHPKGDGTPHVEIKGGHGFYVSSERGYEIFRKQAADENELLYFIFRDIISAMANEFEMENRIEGQDPRRLIFSKKLELFGKISQEWKRREELEIKKTLDVSPYDDLASARADYYRELKKSGIPDDEIDDIVYKKYPSGK